MSQFALIEHHLDPADIDRLIADKAGKWRLFLPDYSRCSSKVDRAAGIARRNSIASLSNIHQQYGKDMNEILQTIGAESSTNSMTNNWLLAQVATPNISTTGVENFVKQTSGTVGAFLPNLVGAILTLLIGWLVAVVVSSVVTKLLKRTDVDNKIFGFLAGGSNRQQFNSEKLVGNIVFWLIFLSALSMALTALNLTGAAQPLNNVLAQVYAFLPKLASAAALAGIAWLLATAVKTIVVRTAGTVMPVMSRRLAVGENQVMPSETLGTALYWFVFLVFLPGILGALEIRGILEPIQNLLNEILAALPRILTAGAIVVFGYIASQLIGNLVASVLQGLGFNNVFHLLGLNSLHQSTLTDVRTPSPTGSVQPKTTKQTPAEIAGVVAQIGVVLFATVWATSLLGIPELTDIVRGLLDISAKVLSGVALFAVGLYVANIAQKLVSSPGTHQAQVLGQIARLAILAFVGATALRMVLPAGSGEIVNLAFGLLLGAVAVAMAISFGLGGRDVAAEQLRDWMTGFREKR